MKVTTTGAKYLAFLPGLVRPAIFHLVGPAEDQLNRTENYSAITSTSSHFSLCLAENSVDFAV